MIKHFRILPFIAGLAVGYYLLTQYTTDPRTIYEYPHPSNIDTKVYTDTNGFCYGYTVKEVSCDQHESTIRPYPIQA